MDEGRTANRLRILLAGAGTDRTTSVAQVVAALGHEVIVQQPDVDDLTAVAERERPDVALVGAGDDPERALELIESLVDAGVCSVILLVATPDSDFVQEASRRGVFAFITDRPGEDWRSAIDIGLRRFTEYQALQRAFSRRAVTERAKGILMERHGVDEETAFRMLREHARTTNSKLIDVASAVAVVHVLLPGRRAAGASLGRATRRARSTA